MSNYAIDTSKTIRRGMNINKNAYKICAVIALGILPTAMFATYTDCREAGGGFWKCAYEAAMNDQIAPGGGEPLPKTETQFKKAYAEKIGQCSKLPVGRQMDCVTKRVSKSQRKVTRPVIKTQSSGVVKSR